MQKLENFIWFGMSGLRKKIELGGLTRVFGGTDRDAGTFAAPKVRRKYERQDGRAKSPLRFAEINWPG
jgi:hypothetical protein